MGKQLEAKELRRKKKLLRTIFHVYEKNMSGETVDELLNSIKKHRPELEEKVDALQELYSHKSGEGFLEIGAVVRQSREVYSRFREEMKTRKQEEVWTILLDNKYRVIERIMVTKGTLNRSLVHPRETFAPAVEKRAAAVILMHNHPSGDSQPSGQDIDITKRLVEAGNILGIPVQDHIIIGNDQYFSFADEGLI